MEFTNLYEIKLEKIEPFGFIDKNELNLAMDKLSIIKIMLDELYVIVKEINNIPNALNDALSSYTNTIFNFFIRIEEKSTNKNSETIAREKTALINEINTFYNNYLNIGTNDGAKFFLLYSTIKNFSDAKIKNIKEEFKTQRDELDKEIDEIKKIKNNLDLNYNESRTILDELKKKVSEQTVSDYAIVFQTEAKNKNKIAKIWLITGLASILVFIITLILFSILKILPTENLDDKFHLINYNFSNIITKAILYAILIFLISFSFKQYNINKHLTTINTHRQNALNSYKLFAESIVGNDSSYQNALMVQVAKAIYEQSQTGFLSKENNQGLNSGIVELTKIIGDNKA